MRRHDLFIELDLSSDQLLYLQIYSAICAHITSGSIKEGDKLPSIRGLAQSLNVSHATVERAYSQLALEGFVANVPRSGYVVNKIDTEYFEGDRSDAHLEMEKLRPELSNDPFLQEIRAGKSVRYDFAFAALQPGMFPRKEFIRALTESFKSATDADLVNYNYGNEPDILQVELAKYLNAARGVSCDPEQIILQNGTEAALGNVLQLFGGEVNCIGHEEPGFEVVIAVAKRFGIDLVSLPVLDSHERDWLSEVNARKPKLIFTTPSHQFPTGRIMPLEERVSLIQWAQENDAYIIEDDSCNEYRYNSRAVPSLQSLDKHNRVIYLCNFSKALSPGLRMAYIVLPPQLLVRWKRAFTFSSDSVPMILRRAMGSFIAEGQWNSHLRRMIADNKPRHDALVKAFRAEFGDVVSLSGVDSGMHLFVTVHNDMSQEKLLSSALAHEVNVYGTKRYWFSKEGPENQVMIGFSAIDLKDIPAGVRALKQAWFPEGPKSSN